MPGCRRYNWAEEQGLSIVRPTRSRSTDLTPHRTRTQGSVATRDDARRRGAQARRDARTRRDYRPPSGLLRDARVCSAQRKSDENTSRRFSLTKGVVDRRTKRANKRWNYRCQIYQAVHFQSPILETRLWDFWRTLNILISFHSIFIPFNYS